MTNESEVKFDKDANTIIRVEYVDPIKKELEEVTSNLTYAEWFGDDRQERDE